MVFRTSLFLSALFALSSSGVYAQKASEDLPEVTVVVFSDFQCPFCVQFAAPVRELQAKGVDGVRTAVKFRNFPLVIHPDAQLAHQAAMAAREQGKFWEMHDLLFANRSAAKRRDLIAYAEKLGLDMTHFRNDLDSEHTKKLIESDKAEGEKRGVEATPTFFINGQPYTGTHSFDQLKELVQSEARRLQAISEISDGLMAKGPEYAPVRVDFFADLGSPISRSAIATLNQLVARYPAEVRLQFRNFPLSFHRLADLAHEAAMDGAREGHFWEFATFILDHQDSLEEHDLIEYAGTLGLDKANFAAELQRHRYHARVDADLAEAARRGVRGSPCVFVNGKRIDGVPDLKTLTEYVEAELAAKPYTSASKH